MVRCRWCLDITVAGPPDLIHVEHEKECLKEWDGMPEYYNLELITHKDKDFTKLYLEDVDRTIKSDYPDYWKTLEEFRNKK